MPLAPPDGLELPEVSTIATSDSGVLAKVGSEPYSSLTIGCVDLRWAGLSVGGSGEDSNGRWTKAWWWIGVGEWCGDISDRAHWGKDGNLDSRSTASLMRGLSG